MKKNVSLRMRMMGGVCAIVFLALSITIGVVTMKAADVAKKGAHDQATQIAQRYGSEVKFELEKALDTSRPLAQAISGGLESETPFTRKQVVDLLGKVAADNTGLFGLWLGFEPNAYDGDDAGHAGQTGSDGKGRFTPNWERYTGDLRVRAMVDFENREDKDNNWYFMSLDSGREAITDIYSFDIRGQKIMLASLTVPVKKNGRTIGVAGIDISLDSLQKLVSDVNIYGNGHITIISDTGAIVAHPATELSGKPFSEAEPWARPFIDAIKAGDGFKTESWSEKLGDHVQHICAPISIGDTGQFWAVLVSIPNLDKPEPKRFCE